MTKLFHTTRRVEFGETDLAGVVHFANFFRYMESAEVEFLRSRGVSVRLKWEGQEIGFPRVSVSCDYYRPAFFQDVIDIDISLDRIGDKSVTYVFEFSRDGTLLARGSITSVCCRVLAEQKFESMAIPQSYRDRIEKWSEPKSEPEA